MGPVRSLFYCVTCATMINLNGAWSNPALFQTGSIVRKRAEAATRRTLASRRHGSKTTASASSRSPTRRSLAGRPRIALRTKPISRSLDTSPSSNLQGQFRGCARCPSRGRREGQDGAARLAIDANTQLRPDTETNARFGSFRRRGRGKRLLGTSRSWQAPRDYAPHHQPIP